jgi:hypothetical protein
MLIKWLTLMLASLSVSTVAIFFAYQQQSSEIQQIDRKPSEIFLLAIAASSARL